MCQLAGGGLLHSACWADPLAASSTPAMGAVLEGQSWRVSTSTWVLHTTVTQPPISLPHAPVSEPFPKATGTHCSSSTPGARNRPRHTTSASQPRPAGLFRCGGWRHGELDGQAARVPLAAKSEPRPRAAQQMPSSSSACDRLAASRALRDAQEGRAGPVSRGPVSRGGLDWGCRTHPGCWPWQPRTPSA